MRFLITAILTSISLFAFGVGFSYAQSNELFSLPGRAAGTGTHFEITDSEYLNISLDSANEITVSLESVPKTISLIIEASSIASSTELTIAGLEPNVTYYKYEDNYKNEAVFVADGQGSRSWIQDLTQFHHLRIEEEKGTIIIPEDCLEYERWDEVTKTCIFTNDPSPSGFINSQDNIGLGEWQWTIPLPGGRRYHGSVVYNNYLYVIGGLGSDSTAVWYGFISNDGQINQWNPTTSLPKTMANLTAVVYNNYLYIMGGWEPYGPTYNDVLYAPIYENGEIGNWVPTTPLPKGTAGHTSFAHNGYLYSVGGMYRYPFFPNQYYNSILRASSNSDGTIGPWIEIGVLPTSLVAHTSFVKDGYLYVAGGFDGSGARNEVWYTPISPDGVIGTWATTAPLPVVKAWHTSALENNKVYVIGGGNDIQNVWYAQIKSDGSIENWSLTNPLLKGRASHSSVSLNGYVYAIGGYDYGANTYYREAEYAPFIAEPSTISNLSQYKSDGQTEISEGSITTESAVVFEVTLNDPDNDQVKLQVELKEFNQPFDGINLIESDFVPSGQQATITRYGLVDGRYHWRARAVDARGAVSVWQEFGAMGNTDFEVRLPLSTKAALLAKQLANHPEAYLWGGKGWDYGRSEFISAPDILAGYEYLRGQTGIGVDCSGLITWAFDRIADSTKPAYENFVKYVNADGLHRDYQSDPVLEINLQSGDAMFFDWNNDGFMDHTAMYVGEGGEYDVVNAADEVRGITTEVKKIYRGIPGFVDFRRIHEGQVAMQVRSGSPIDLIVTDPDGFKITPVSVIESDEEYIREIPGELYYLEVERGADGNPIDIIYSPVLKQGDYTITVLPAEGSQPTDTYSLNVTARETTINLASNVSISDIPTESYLVRSSEGKIEKIIPVKVSIEPKTLNISSKGVFTAFIQIEKGFGATIYDINPETITISEAKPIKTTIDEESGILIVKFNRQDLVGVATGNQVKLTLSGKLFDGTAFEGTDVIRMIDKKANITASLYILSANVYSIFAQLFNTIWSFLVDKLPLFIKPANKSIVPLTQPSATTTSSSSAMPEHKTYRNTEFGFEFEYPEDWNIRQPAFGSAVSKFNMDVEPPTPLLPHPVTINILPNDWVDRVRSNFASRGIVSSEIKIDGVTGYGYEHISEGLPQVDYLFARDEYWIVVGGKKQYEETLNKILASFKFIPKTEYKTYRNEEWGFEFQYPEDWTLHPTPPVWRNQLSKFELIATTPEEKVPNTIIPTFLVNLVTADFADRAAISKRNLGATTSTVTVGGVQGTKSEYVFANSPRISIDLPFGKDRLLLGANRKYEDVFNQILASFKFIPKTESNLYRNEEWGFEFQYPEDWILKENTFGSYYSKFNLVIRPTTDWYQRFPVDMNVVLPEFPDLSFNKKQEAPESAKGQECLTGDEIATYDMAKEGIVRGVLQVFIKDLESNLGKFNFNIDDVSKGGHAVQMYECSVYVARVFNYDDEKGVPLPDYRTELWRFRYDGAGEKLIDLFKKEGEPDNYSKAFVVDSTESYIALVRSYFGNPNHAIVIKNLLDVEGDDAFILTLQEVINEYPQVAGSFNVRDWIKDGRYFWGDIFDGAYVLAYLRIDTVNWKADIFEAPDGAMGGMPLNVDTGYVPIQPGLVWTGDAQLTQELKEQYRKEGRKSSFYLYDLFTKEKLFVASDNEPLWSFKPKWLSDTELQYELPTGEKKIYKINQ